MTITVNANLFRLAYSCVSTDETRCYLNGVFVEPHPCGGVNLIATDGHRLIVVYDETGRADEAAIVRLSKDALKACKAKSNRMGAIEFRTLIVEGSRATIEVQPVKSGERYGDSSIAATCPDAVIDGTFPDYRRVIPTIEEHGAPGAFNSAYIGEFSDVAHDLPNADGAPSRGSMRIMCSTPDSPAIILFPSCAFAFGVLMPIRANDVFGVPAFFTARPEVAPAEIGEAAIAVAPSEAAEIAPSDDEMAEALSEAIAEPEAVNTFKPAARFLNSSRLAVVTSNPAPINPPAAPSCVLRIVA